MSKQIIAIVLLIVLLVGTCTASFFIGKGSESAEKEYYIGVVEYGFKHCVMYDLETDQNYFAIVNQTFFLE